MIDIEDLREVVDHVEQRVEPPSFQAIEKRAQQRRRTATLASVVAALILVVGVGGVALSLWQSGSETLVTASRDDVSAQETGVSEEDGLVVSDEQFFRILEQGPWKLVAGSETFPDRDFVDQRVRFSTIVEPADRMSFRGGECFGVSMFLRWSEPGLATVTPNETGRDIVRSLEPCSNRTPGIANHPAPFGSTVRISIVDDQSLRMELADRHSREIWSAEFELDQ